MASAAPLTVPPRPPGGSSTALAVDELENQAVENIPKDTLVALLKRKDKDAKSVSAKLAKVEERYVKVVRFNKILMEDRASFLRFCNELLPECEPVFEEAAAQEIPVNLEALVRRLSAWRTGFENAREDRDTFKRFAELVFPCDEVVAQLFDNPSLRPEAFDTLQNRWVALEELRHHSLASIDKLSREQLQSKTQELHAAQAARLEAERRTEEIQKEKALMLTRKIGNATGFAEVSLSNGTLGGSPERLLEEAREQLKEQHAVAIKQQQEALKASQKKVSDLQIASEVQQADIQRWRAEAERHMRDSDTHRAQAQQLSEQREQALDQLQAKMREVDGEVGGNAFIERMAEQQAGRDVEMRNQQKQFAQVASTLAEIQRLLSMSYTQERLLKERIRELEQNERISHTMDGTNVDYLKHVIVKYIEYNQRCDTKAQSLVPVLCTLLSLPPEISNKLSSPIPQAFLLLNQAVGETALWFRRGSGSAESNAAHPPAAVQEPRPAILEQAETLLANAQSDGLLPPTEPPSELS